MGKLPPCGVNDTLHHDPAASSWEFHTPTRSPFPPAVGHSPASGGPCAGREDRLPARGVGAVVLGGAAEEEEESWAEQMGVQPPGTLLRHATFVCAHVRANPTPPSTSHPDRPSRWAARGGWGSAQGLALGIGQDGAGSPGDAPGGCRALGAEAGDIQPRRGSFPRGTRLPRSAGVSAPPLT